MHILTIISFKLCLYKIFNFINIKYVHIYIYICTYTYNVHIHTYRVYILYRVKTSYNLEVIGDLDRVRYINNKNIKYTLYNIFYSIFK